MDWQIIIDTLPKFVDGVFEWERSEAEKDAAVVCFIQAVHGFRVG